MKRIFDFVFSFLGLIILAPLFLILVILIKFCDNGPVFFKQERIGKCEKPFLLYKFRSMRVPHADIINSFEPGNVSRVTTIGRFLRKTKLDELPQLYNVLRGDLSLVGPRPEVKKWVDIYPDRWKKILSIRPGITDNASIMFKDEEEILTRSGDPERTYKDIILPKKLDLYEDYLTNNSFCGDIKLIFKTIFSVLTKS